MSIKRILSLSGQSLLADFQAVFAATATTEAAQSEAERSESALMSHLTSLSKGTLLNPMNLAGTPQIDVARASLDAHIKKVQAKQLNSMNLEQMHHLVLEDRNKYHGKKIRVNIIAPAHTPILSVWFDDKNGFRHNRTTKHQVVGTIDEVLLDKNLLILKPTRGSRLINSNLQNYVINVVDPETLFPMVEITML